MQQSNMEDMADMMCDMIMDYFKDRVDDFVISDIYDNDHEKMFRITFIAYRYFFVNVLYDHGNITSFINYGESMIRLYSSQKYSYTPDTDIVMSELEQELELRIPDKYLKAKGWL